MGKYRFFGTESAIGALAATRYGQVLDLDDADAARLVAAHPPALIVPEAVWAKAGISDEELAAWPSTLIHGAAPDAFRAKTDAVRAAYHDYRAGLLAGLPLADQTGANAAKAAPVKAPVKAT
jgi:hypothetical protein